MIIAISAKIQHGKDTVGQMIQSITREKGDNYEIKKFAGKLKQIVALLIGCTVEQLEDQNFKSTPLSSEWDIKFPHDSDGFLVKSMTPRLMLQLIGTECAREIIHPNTWLNALYADYKQDSNWIITDCRFPNEAKSVKEKRGIVIRVERPSIVNTSDHPSETSLDDYKDFDEVIINDGTIHDLGCKVIEVLKKHYII